MPLCCRCNKSGRCRNCVSKGSLQVLELLAWEGRTVPKWWERNQLDNQWQSSCIWIGKWWWGGELRCEHQPRQWCRPGENEWLATIQSSSFSQFYVGRIRRRIIYTHNQYAEIVHWKRNLFKIPSGKAGSAFTRELAWLFRWWEFRHGIDHPESSNDSSLLDAPKTASQVQSQGSHQPLNSLPWIVG